jgi:hypothetical protein
MSVQLEVAELKKTKWYEFAIRFLFGGAITVITGLIAKHYGPVFGGLFLAFPAIFPASATLVETHEKRKKLQAGIPRTMRGVRSGAGCARLHAGNHWAGVVWADSLEIAAALECGRHFAGRSWSVVRRFGFRMVLT